MTTVPLSYMIRQSQLQVARALAAWLYAPVPLDRAAPNDIEPGWDQKGPIWDGRERTRQIWAPAHQLFDARDGTFRCWFDHQGFDPELSDWQYGPEETISSDLEVLEDHSYLFDNTNGVEPLDIDLEEAVTYHNSRTTTTSQTISLDFGAKEKGTIGGEKQGASLEVEVTEAFGIKTDTAEAKTESTDVTRKQAIRTTVPKGKAVLATIESPTLKTSRDFTIDGVWLSSIKIAFDSRFDAWEYIKEMVAAPGRVSRVDGNQDTSWLADVQITEVSWPSWDDFLAMVGATNVDFPDVVKPMRFADVENAVHDRRRIQWHGRELRTAQHAAA